MTRHERLHEVSSTGDFYGGMWVLAKREDGSLFVEAWEGPDEGDDAPVYPWTTFTVYRAALPTDVAKEHAWAYPFDGADPEAGRDADPVRRAWELDGLARHHGWHEIDQYPLSLTAQELWERWGDPGEDPRVEYLDPQHHDAALFDGSAVVPRARLTEAAREELAARGVDRLYGALLSAEAGGWDFWLALAEAVRRIGKTHDADVYDDSTHAFAVAKTEEHLWKMEGPAVPRADAVAFLADPKAGVAKVLRPRESHEWAWPRWREEKA